MPISVMYENADTNTNTNTHSPSLPTPPSTASLPAHTYRRSGDALIRKRERDKQNQRKKREREREYIADLESKVLLLEAKLSAGPVQCYDSASISQPPSTTNPSPQGNADCIPQNEHRRRPSVHFSAAEPLSSASLPMSMTSPTTGTIPPSFSPENSELQQPLVQTPLTSPATTASSPTYVHQDSLLVSSAVLTKLLAVPEWRRVPLWNVQRPSSNYRFLDRGQRFVPVMSQLRGDPTGKVICPPSPKTLDLLFGGSSNPLANFIHSELIGLPFLPPEKFSSSYLIYMYMRWLVWPTEENFYRFPESFRPTMLQLVQEHHLSFDLFPWPQMRDNFIRHRSQYDLEHIIGLFSCTIRIRGSFGKEFITRANDGDPEVEEEFIRQSFDASQWCLLERFWVECPDLVEGLDPGLMLREETLKPT